MVTMFISYTHDIAYSIHVLILLRIYYSIVPLSFVDESMREIILDKK